MRTMKAIAVLGLLFLAFSCSSNDDDSSETSSMENLLTSGKWYQESKTPGSFSDCEKNNSFQFNEDGSVIFTNYEDNSGSCVVLDPITASYTLNGSSITISVGSEIVSATINSITTDELSITDSKGDTIVFDKTQG